MSEKNTKRGRKSIVDEWRTPEKLLLLQGWRRDGLDLVQISKNIGIHRATLFKWCAKYDDISNALKAGAEVAMYEIENQLYESAKNRYVEELEIIETRDASGETVQRVTKKHRRFVPGNTAAQIFILKNRRANHWRERPDLMIDQNSVQDDGFIKALQCTAAEDWADEAEDSNIQI